MEIHSCSYFCDMSACIKSQRDELRDKTLKNAERYQTLRKMNAKQFADVYSKAQGDGKTFDERVDDLYPFYAHL